MEKRLTLTDSNDASQLKYEAELAAGAAKGNRESLARLLHSVYPRVYGYVLKLCYDRELAKDIVQSAMETAIRRFETYRSEKGAFITWISKIAVNLLSDHYRKTRHEVPLDTETMEADTVQANFEGVQDIEPVLARLSPALRMPVVMQFIMGYSQKEIAEILKIPFGTVKSRVHNALAFLKKELGNEEGYK